MKNCKNCKNAHKLEMYFKDEHNKLKPLWSGKHFIAHCPLLDDYVTEEDNCNKWANI